MPISVNPIEEIIKNGDIKSGYIFDAHMVIAKLVENYNAEYVKLAQGHKRFNEIHSKISKKIRSFEKRGLIERIPEKSFSKNAKGNYTSCTCWKKL